MSEPIFPIPSQRAPKPLLNIGAGSGQPNMPAGEPPFVPINAWGRLPPKPTRQPRPALYQVWVRDTRRGNQPMGIGPKMIKDMADRLCSAIRGQIALGAEKQWIDPVVVMMS
jgi:hypothetical protein